MGLSGGRGGGLGLGRVAEQAKKYPDPPLRRKKLDPISAGSIGSISITEYVSVVVKRCVPFRRGASAKDRPYEGFCQSRGLLSVRTLRIIAGVPRGLYGITAIQPLPLALPELIRATI
jgi:hypothetical protein